ncbi:MAG: SAM-dependent methyltransferase [Candidatus Promineifilaceae bacterium]
MTYSLEDVVPWGRNLMEYQAMFELTSADLQSTIIGVSDGPASFNSELTAQGGRVVSVDPIYQFSAEQIERRIDTVVPIVMGQLRENQHEFVWQLFNTPDQLEQARLAAMRAFLDDFPKGLAEKRYQSGELPTLAFADRQFDLALCSHFLFLYSAQFDADFHLAAIHELCRVAQEVRIFPVLELGSIQSRHLSQVMKGLREGGFLAELQTVNYEFQRGGNQMLRINQ